MNLANEARVEVLADNACDRNGRRREQYALLRKRLDQEYEELSDAIEFVKDRKKDLLAAMDRKQPLSNGAAGAFRVKLQQDINVLDGKISFEEAEGLEKKKKEMKDLMKERRRTEVEGWTDPGLARGG